MRLDLRSPKSSHYHGPAVRFKAASAALVVVMSVYLCSAYVQVGWLTYLLTLPACFVLIVTAVARINDMGVEMASTFWNVRRIGLILVGVYGVSQIITPLIGAVEDWPTWPTVIATWGFALVWITTPNQPPWGHYIWRHIPRGRDD